MARTATQIERARQARKDVVEVRPGEYVPAEAYQTLSREEKARLREGGVEALTQARQQKQAKYVAALAAISSYKLGDDSYDLDKLITDGYTTEQLVKLGFDGDAVEKRRSVLGVIKDYATADGYDLVAMLRKGFTPDQLKSYGFVDSDIAFAVHTWKELQAIETYKDSEGNYDLVQMLRDARKSSDLVLALGGPGAVDSDLDNLLMGLGFSEESIKEAEDAIANSVELRDGTSVTKESWDALDKEHQDLLNQLGLVRFTEAMEAEQQELERTHVEVSDDNWVVKAEWDALTPAQQKEVIATGKYTVVTTQYLTIAQVNTLRFAASYAQAKMMADAWGISETQLRLILDAPTDVAAQVYASLQEEHPESLTLTHTPATVGATQVQIEKIFLEMQASGAVPKGAVLQSYNPETGDITFTVPDTQAPEQIDEPVVTPATTATEPEPNWFTTKHDPVIDTILGWFTTPHESSWDWLQQPHPSAVEVGGQFVEQLQEAAEIVAADSGADQGTKLTVSGAAGLGLLGLTLLVAPGQIVGTIVSNPKGTPSFLYDVAKGMVLHVGNTVYNILSNKYTKDIIENNNLLPLLFDTGMSLLILEGVGKGVVGAVKRVTTWVLPRSIPPELIAREISTGRIPITMKEFAINYAEAMNEALIRATKRGGTWKGDVPIEGTPYSLCYVKSPLGMVIGDVVFHGAVDGLKFVREAGETLKVGASGLYTDPWAALGYTRGTGIKALFTKYLLDIKDSSLFDGTKVTRKGIQALKGKGAPATEINFAMGKHPGLLMILTDATKVKSGAKGLVEGPTQSSAFIVGQKAGFYGPSKTWRGDLETEIVGAPRTRASVPPAGADMVTSMLADAFAESRLRTKLTVPPSAASLINRILAGDFADFLTYDSGKFVPIKLALDTKSFLPSTLRLLSDPAIWYAVKLKALEGALVSTMEALKHPGAILKDVWGTGKEMLNFERMIREGTGGGSMTPPGIRDIYLIESLGSRLRTLRDMILRRALVDAKRKAGPKVAVDSAVFRRALAESLRDTYARSADALIRTFKSVSDAYASSSSTRQMFEDAYLADLGVSALAVTKYGSASTQVSDTLQNVSKSYKVTPSDVASVSAYSKASAKSSDVSEMSSIISSVISPYSRDGITSRDITSRPDTSTPESSIVSSSGDYERSYERPYERERPVSSGRGTRSSITPRFKGSRSIREVETPPPPTKRPMPSPAQSEEEGGPEAVPGTYTWKQGITGWRSIPPPYDIKKPLWSKLPPKGARVGGRTPAETIQVVNPTGKEPKSISVDLGISDIFIKGGGKGVRPTIEFKAHGMKTDVGTRIPGPEKGLSLDDEPTGLSLDEEPTGIPERAVKAVSQRSQAPKKREKRRSWLDEVGSLKGYRF